MAKSGTQEHLARWHASLINEHRAWLARFNEPERIKIWDGLLEREPEAALCEAYVRRLLNQHVYTVWPGWDLSGRGPDFRCLQMNRHFHVETACLTIDAATEATGLSHLSRRESGHRPLTRSLLEVCSGKAAVCGTMDDAPCLLAVATLHRAASERCFYDRTAIEDLLTTDPGVMAGLEESARGVISGLLLCGFGVEPPKVHGVLNPAALRPFERRLLPDIPFCRAVQAGSSAASQVEWL